MLLFVLNVVGGALWFAVIRWRCDVGKGEAAGLGGCVLAGGRDVDEEL